MGIEGSLPAIVKIKLSTDRATVGQHVQVTIRVASNTMSLIGRLGDCTIPKFSRVSKRRESTVFESS